MSTGTPGDVAPYMYSSRWEAGDYRLKHKAPPYCAALAM